MPQGEGIESGDPEKTGSCFGLRLVIGGGARRSGSVCELAIFREFVAVGW